MRKLNEGGRPRNMMIKEEARDISGEERGLPRRTSRGELERRTKKDGARAAEMKAREVK